MLRAESWRVVVLAMSLVLIPVRSARAESSAPQSPQSVELVLVGQAQSEPSLFHRVRSLFDPGTQFSFDKTAQLDPNAVLRPQSPGTLYLWITLNADDRARVYVATRELNWDSARYLYRDVILPSGFDEVGSETLAQIAHSSARALWAREQQISRSVVLTAIEDDRVAQSAPVPATSATVPQPPVPSPSPANASVPVHSIPAPPPRPNPVQFVLAAQYAMHASGGEGWLDEPGGLFALTLRERFSARLAAAYLLPQRFNAPLTRIRLTGFLSELRLGWRTGAANGLRGYLETGLGVLFADWTAESVPPASGLPGRSQQRVYALSSIGGEWTLGAVVLGARAELRIPFRETTYEVVGNNNYSWSTHTWLNPGFAIEVGIPLDRLF